MTTQSLIGFGTIMTTVDNPVILSEEQIAQIVARVLAALSERQRETAMKLRESKLTELRAIEELHGLSRAIPTRKEDGHGFKDEGYLNRDRKR